MNTFSIFRSLKNQRGLSAIMMIVIVAVVTTASVGLSSLFVDRLKDEQQISLQQGVEMVRRNVQSTIGHDKSWLKTIEQDSNLSCLRTNGTVCGSGQKSFTLRLANSQVLVPGAKGTQGFDRLGNVCNEFNESAGNDKCPFRYSLQWECDGACVATKIVSGDEPPTEPKVKITAVLEFKPGTAAPSRGQGNHLNMERYSFNLIRGREQRDLSSTCKAIGGYFDQGKKHCSIQRGNVSCDPVAEYMAGLNEDGTPICRKKLMLNKECTTGHAIVGITALGDIKCGKF